MHPQVFTAGIHAQKVHCHTVPAHTRTHNFELLSKKSYPMLSAHKISYFTQPENCSVHEREVLKNVQSIECIKSDMQFIFCIFYQKADLLFACASYNQNPIFCRRVSFDDAIVSIKNKNQGKQMKIYNRKKANETSIRHRI